MSPTTATVARRPVDAPLLPLVKPAFEDWGPKSLARWTPAGFPDGQGGTWMWAEPGAKTRLEGGRLELKADPFTRKHDVVQIFDNPKHLLACAQPITVPDEGVRIDTTIAAAVHRATNDDWGEGFASFNLMDFEHGLVLDGLANNRRTAILFERLNIPGMIPLEQSFTTIAEGPASTAELQEHKFTFQYEPLVNRIRGWIDDKPILDHRNVHFRIKQFTPGFGLITLRPIQNGASTSLRGQGATGRLGAIHTSRLK